MPPSKPVPYVGRDGEQRTKGGRLGWRLRVMGPRRQIERVFYGSYEEAVIEMGKWRTEVERQTDQAAVSRNATVADFLLWWLEHEAKWAVKPSSNGRSKGTPAPYSTFRKRKDSVARSIECLGASTKLRDLTYQSCYDAIAGLTHKKTGKPMKSSSKQTVSSTLKIALKAAVRDGWIPYNPAAELPNRWDDNPTKAMVAIPSIRQLESQAAAMDDALGNALRVLGYTGLRLSELAGLKIDSIDFERRTISVHRKIVFTGGRSEEREITKSPAGKREIVILDQAVPALKALIERSEAQGSPYLVCGERGMRMNASTWNRAIRDCKLTGVTTFSAHMYRHTFASLLFATGMPVDQVAVQMGHSTPVVTQRIYVHVMAISQAELAKKLSAQVTKLVAESTEL